MADPALPNGFDRIPRSGADTSKGKGCDKESSMVDAS
jgi:hypothetical protein